MVAGLPPTTNPDNLPLDQGAPYTCTAPPRDLLPRARSQPPDPPPDLSAGPNTAAAQRARDNDPMLHSGADMFSCGSLASRFGKEYYIKSDGCMDYGFSR